MRSREIASFTIENAQGRVSVAVGDTVTIHTLMVAAWVAALS